MKKKVIASIVAVVLALATCITLVACVPNNKETVPENSVAIGDNGFMTENNTYALPRAMSFSQKGLDRSATNSVSINVYATVYPDSAPNKEVDWFISWADGYEGEEVTNFVNVIPESDGSPNATITCYQAFEGKIIVTVVTREGKFSADCEISFIGKPSGLDILGGGLGNGTGSFGDYMTLGSGVTYEFSIVPTNEFNHVGTECSYSVDVVGFGYIVTKDNTLNTNTDARTWIEGTEEIIGLDDIDVVSPFCEKMYDVNIQGDTLYVTFNCTPESYLKSQTRVSTSKIEYDNQFFSFGDDDYWFYEITVTENTTGITKTFKVRPVQSVNGVSLSMGDYQF